MLIRIHILAILIGYEFDQQIASRVINFHGDISYRLAHVFIGDKTQESSELPDLIVAGRRGRGGITTHLTGEIIYFLAVDGDSQTLIKHIEDGGTTDRVGSGGL